MKIPKFSAEVIVSDRSMKDEEPYEVVGSNIAFLNALLGEHLRYDELAPDALRSYYVDYYLAQVNNGGFAQFVYNSRWDKGTVRFVREGLEAMGAKRHLKLFNESATIIDRVGPDGMERFFASEYFGDNKERDTLNAFNDAFYKLSKNEDLIELNSRWLKSLPNLHVMTVAEMEAEVARRATALPDREQRIAAALAAEPRYKKLIRALCAAAGHKLDRVTAGDPTYQHKGKNLIAWHFLTDHGLHHMVDADGKAVMFEGGSRNNGQASKRIAEIDAPEDFGK